MLASLTEGVGVMGQFEGVVHLSVSTESTTKIPWENMWDDMPYKKTQFKITTIKYKAIIVAE